MIRPALALFAIGCACGGPGRELRGRVQEVGRVIETARGQGAANCAPVELATAEAHHDFAGLELEEGDYRRARSELAVAEKAARDAVRFSPPERCADGQAGADHDNDGVLDERDECAVEPEDRDGVEDEDGCPEADSDDDGVTDPADKCTAEPEDKDGFNDEDGCPDPDNDGDHLADRVDQCPDQAEDADATDDDDGCPDCDDDADGVPECPEALDRCPGEAGRPPDGCAIALIAARRIQLKRPVGFATGKAILLPSSRAQLDEVARLLAEKPTLRIRVEAHTDNHGGKRRNLRLSKLRAAAVKRYLTIRGIDKRRIVSEGYGESVPIAENTTPAGRAQNRRIEFVILGR